MTLNFDLEIKISTRKNIDKSLSSIKIWSISQV